MNHTHPLPTPLPASAWGPDAAKVAAHEEWARALDPRHDDDLADAYRRAMEAI